MNLKNKEGDGVKHYTSEELYKMEKPKRPEAFDSFPPRWHYSDFCFPFVSIYDGMFKNTGVVPSKLKTVIIENIDSLYEAAAPSLDKRVDEEIREHKTECARHPRSKIYGYDTMEERLPIIRDYFEDLYAYLFMEALRKEVEFVRLETVKEILEKNIEGWNKKSFIEKQIIKSQNTVKPAWLKEGWFVYILVLILAFLFQGTIKIWVLATIYFFIWRKIQIDKFN